MISRKEYDRIPEEEKAKRSRDAQQARDAKKAKRREKTKKKKKTSDKPSRQRKKKPTKTSKINDLAFVLTHEFLESYEWRKLRYRALLLHGRKCQCCGSSPPTIVLHVDHIKPRKHYPHLARDINNLQVLCHVCNHGKGNWDETDFRRYDRTTGDPEWITKDGR